jgi:glutamyl-Q tRNA(Asp) synthetase
MMLCGNNLTVYRGRFAPSPTGPLHMGSLVAAVGSYLDAKSNHGEWLVRIDDLDPPRIVPGASKNILSTLESLGMEWDSEVVYQSQRSDIYQEALASLNKLGLIYPCVCTRKEIAGAAMMGMNGPIYPGTCRNNRSVREKLSAWRIKTKGDPIVFQDLLSGSICQRLNREVGDFVLQRADGVYAYQLAVVVDDAEQNITHVVRGVDLQDSTPRQIYLQQLLGYPMLMYMHLPLVTNHAGEKLSKQTQAAPVDLSNALAQLVTAIRFLGQEPPESLNSSDIPSFWQWAIQNWRPAKIPYEI